MNRSDIHVGDELFYYPKVRNGEQRVVHVVKVISLLPKRVRVASHKSVFMPLPEQLMASPFSDVEDDL